MKTVALRKSGGSMILAVPAFFTETNQLSAGDRVEIVMQGQDMIVRPARRPPRYSMAQLLAEHADDGIPSMAEWENLPPVGLETE
jgi:antitoxin ChpS